MFISRRHLILLAFMLLALVFAAFFLGTTRSNSTTQLAAVATPTVATTQPTAPPTFTASATASVTPSPTATKTATNAFTRTPYRTETPYPTPTPFTVTSPNPPDLDLVRLIANRHYADFYWSQSEEAISKGKYDSFSRTNQDVNSDGKPEVIILGDLYDLGSYLSILQYDEKSKQWQEMYYLANIADWTAHEIAFRVNGNQVELSTKAGSHGTGMNGATWSQTWIRCSAITCQEVWKAPVMYYESQSQSDVNSIYYQVSTRQIESEFITLSKETFGVATEYIWTPDGERHITITHRTIGPMVTERYKWNGTEYALAEQTETAPQQDVVRESTQATTELDDFIDKTLTDPLWEPLDGDPHVLHVDKNKFARVESDFWGFRDTEDASQWKLEMFNPQSGRHSPRAIAAVRTSHARDLVAAVLGANDNDQCRLAINEYRDKRFIHIGHQNLECTPSFTRVVWHDIDGDDKDELLFITIPLEQVEEQQLYIFRVDQGVKEIARLSGSLNGTDGAGVRWEQRDGETIFFAGIAPTEECEDFSCLATPRRWKTYHWDAKTEQLVEEKMP